MTSLVLAAASDAPAIVADQPQESTALTSAARYDFDAVESSSFAGTLQPELTLDTPSPFGTKNSLRLYFQAAGAVEFADSNNWFLLGGAGVSYFLIDDVSLDFELNGMFIDQIGDDAGAINLNMLARWHFISRPTWSLFVDGGAGLFWATDNVPAIRGSHFNFTPQLGGGVSWEVSDNVRMMAGARWHHISNANLFEFNDGRDSLMLYLGVSLPF